MSRVDVVTLLAVRAPGRRCALAALAVVVLLGVGPAAAVDPADFQVYLYGEVEAGTPAERAEAIAAAGFTVADWSADELDALEGTGLEAMVHGATPTLARKLRHSPVVWGYHVRDEPYPESQFPELGAAIRDLHAADPNHPGYINMLSTAGHFVRDYLRVVQPPLLSFDYYQWWWGPDRFFEKLEQFREDALRADVPLGSYVETTANSGSGVDQSTYLADNGVKLRQSVYANLAYGVTLLSWYNQSHVFRPGTLELSATGRDVAALNAELAHVGPVLAGLHSVDVHHTTPLPAGTRSAPGEYWVHLVGEPARDGLILGAFEDDDGNDILVVVNRDIHHDQNVTLKFRSRWLGLAPWHEPKDYSYAVHRLDKATGDWRTVSSESFVGFTTVVGAGDGEVFRVRVHVK